MDLDFAKGDFVFLKVSPCKGIFRFSKKGKLSPRYIGSFEILDRGGDTAYRLEFPENLSRLHNVLHVSMLRSIYLIHLMFYPPSLLICGKISLILRNLFEFSTGKIKCSVPKSFPYSKYYGVAILLRKALGRQRNRWGATIHIYSIGVHSKFRDEILLRRGGLWNPYHN